MTTWEQELTPEERADIERIVAEERAEAKTDRGRLRAARLQKRREYAQRQRQERWEAHLRLKAWREREEQSPSATLRYGRVRDTSRPYWHLIEAPAGEDAGTKTTLCRLSLGRGRGWGMVAAATEAPGTLCSGCASVVEGHERTASEDAHREHTPHYAACKLGARYFWVAWAPGVSPYGNWKYGQQRETPGEQLGLTATAMGYAADWETAVAAAIRAAGPSDYPAGDMRPGWASSYHHRMLLKARAERQAEGHGAAGVELLWSAAWDDGDHDGWRAHDGRVNVTAWRVVKKSKARVYVDRERYDPEHRRSGTAWDYDVKTNIVDRAHLEREGWAERAHRWYQDGYRLYIRREEAIAAANKRRTAMATVPAECLWALGLTPPCTAADVRRAYRKLARTTHPDRGGTHEAFLTLQRAYEDALRLVAHAA